MGGALRVLQAGDFRLHEPLQPVPDLPAHWNKLMISARERSAQKVVDLAIAQRVNLLLLTGSLGNVAEDPRAAWFLTEQFRRLHRAGIEICWGIAEAPRFPAWADLPENLHLLEPGGLISLRLPNGGRSVEIEWLLSAGTAPMRTGVSDAAIQLLNTSAGLEIEYSVRGRSEIARHLAGPTQSNGRPSGTPGGAWLTVCDFVDEFGPSYIETETVAWERESIAVHPGQTLDELKTEIRLQLDQFATDRAAELTLVEFQLVGNGELWSQLASDHLIQQLLEDFSREQLAEDEPIWLWKLDRMPSALQWKAWKTFPPLRIALEERDQLTEADVAAVTHIPPSHLSWGRRFQEHLESPSLTLRLVQTLGPRIAEELTSSRP